MKIPSLVAGFLNAAATHADRFALEVDDAPYTYAELARLAGRIAQAIVSHPAATSPLVTLLTYRSVTAYAGVLGILLSGKGYVPLQPRFPVERTHMMLNLSEADVMVVGEECLEQLSDVLAGAAKALRVILPEGAVVDALAQQFPQHTFVELGAYPDPLPTPSAPQVDQDEAAYLLFTSGSTGVPKGVAVSHRNVKAYVSFICDRYQITEQDRFSQMFDMAFDLSVHDMFVCWERGACLCCVPESALMAPARFIRDKKLTAWFSVPSVGMIMARLKMLKPGAFPSLRLSLFCGEALPATVAAQWQQATPGTIVDNLYGPTEATIAIAYYRWDDETAPAECMNGVVPIGKVFDGHQAYLRDPDGTDEAGEVIEGELCLAGPQVTSGYLNNEKKTREQYITIPGTGEQTWYRTGDLARRDENGSLHFLGRIDNQVKVSGGYRVELHEIDHALREAAGTEMVASVAWPVHDGRAEGIVAFVAGATGKTEQELLAYCKRNLPAYMVPQTVYFMDQLPLNANGKIDRKQCVQYLQEQRGTYA